MRPGESDVLLSAYLDREVTPAEREQVESQLDASPDTRAELDALAELSLCLRTFDRPEAPPDFKASVMQSLAGRRIEGVTVPIPPPVRRSRREWIVLLSATVTSACVVFFVVFWSPMTKPTDWSYSVSDLSDAAHPTEPTVWSDGVRAKRNLASRGDSLEGAAPAMRRESSVSEATGRFRTPSAPMPMAAPLSAPQDAPSGAVLRSEVADTERLPELEVAKADSNALDKVAINDFLHAWAATDAPDRYVANIDLQVLDVQRAARGFQVLLMDNGVANTPLDQAVRANQAGGGLKPATDTFGTEPQNPAEGVSEGMIAVYVDTTTDRVTKSLEEFLSQKNGVVGVRLQQPLALGRSIEGDVLDDSLKELKRNEKGEARATTPADVALQYAYQRTGALELGNDSDVVDALTVVDGTSVKNQSVEESPQLASKSVDPANRAASPAAAMRSMKAINENLKDRQTNTANLSRGLNYCSEVRLPLVNGLDLAANNEASGAALIDPNANRLLMQNSITNNFSRNAVQNQAGGYNGQRYRQANTREANGSVRVLVVFQDVPILTPAKVKADSARP